MIFAYELPETHKTISETEKNYIMNNRFSSSNFFGVKVPKKVLLGLFTNPAALSLYFNHWANAWMYYTILTELPSFLSDSFGTSTSKSGINAVYPYIP